MKIEFKVRRNGFFWIPTVSWDKEGWEAYWLRLYMGQHADSGTLGCGCFWGSGHHWFRLDTGAWKYYQGK